MHSIILFCTLFYNVISDSRILNGKATEGPIPYHVSIQVNFNFYATCEDFTDRHFNFFGFGFGSEFHYSKAINHQHVCGGAILTADFVITAAHCVHGYDNLAHGVSVAVGIYKQSEIKDFQRYCVEGIRSHEEYLNGDHRSDISILKLTRSIDLSNPTMARAIPLSKSFNGFGHQLYVTGWGFINAEQTKSADELQELFFQTQHCVEGPKIFCAWSTNGAICPGDSGSPVTNINQTELVGIVVRSFCAVGKMAYFLKISEFYDWIVSHAVRTHPIHTHIVHDELRSLE